MIFLYIFLSLTFTITTNGASTNSTVKPKREQSPKIPFLSSNHTNTTTHKETRLEYSAKLFIGFIEKAENGNYQIIYTENQRPDITCTVPYGDSNFINLTVQIGGDFFYLSPEGAFGSTEIILLVKAELENSAILFNSKYIYIHIQAVCNGKENNTVIHLHIRDQHSTKYPLVTKPTTVKTTVRPKLCHNNTTEETQVDTMGYNTIALIAVSSLLVVSVCLIITGLIKPRLVTRTSYILTRRLQRDNRGIPNNSNSGENNEMGNPPRFGNDHNHQ